MKKKVIFFLFALMLPIYCFNFTTINTSKSNTLSSKNNQFYNLRRLLLNYGYAEIPLRLSKDKNFLILVVSLRNKNTAEPFLIDTGASLTSIDQKIETQYKFKKYGKEVTTGGAGGNRFRTYKVIIPQMGLGNFIVYNQPAVIQHYSHINIGEKPIAGMIGLDFLRQHQAILDFSHKRLFLNFKNNKIVNKEVLHAALVKMGYESIQLEKSPSGHQTLLVKINDNKPERFMLDSGVFPTIMLDYKYAKTIAVNFNGAPTFGKGSSNGKMKIYTTKITKLTIGRNVTNSQFAVISTGLEFAQIGIPIFGVVGLSWMNSHHAILDTANDFLFVSSNPNKPLFRDY